MKYQEAIAESMRMLSEDERTRFLGYNVRFGSQAYGTLKGIPEVMERSIDTTLLVKNGETIILGGLKVEKDNRSTDGVPYLKDIPLLGYIFRYQEDRKDADELLLIVRPTIISNNTQNNQVSSHPATELNHAGIK